MSYRLLIGPNTGTPTAEINSFTTLTAQFHLDQGDQIVFDVSKYDDAVFELAELETDVWLYENDVVRQRFRVLTIDATWDFDGNDSLAVTAVSYKRLLASRHLMTALTYTAEDQADIVWGVIQHTQGQTGGALGITAGTLTAGTPRDRTYAIGENVLQILSNLSGVVGGPLWTIDANRELDVLLPAGFPTQNTPMVMGVTARVLSRKSGAVNFANVGFADGDSSATVPAIYEDPGLATDPRGRWEQIVGWPNVTEQATLDERAEGIVDAARFPIAEWTCVLEPSRYLSDLPLKPGDFVNMVWPCRRFTVVGYDGEIACQTVAVDLSLTEADELSVTAQLVEIGAAV